MSINWPSKPIDDLAPPPVNVKKKPADPARTWTAGELAHQLRFVPADTQVFIVGRGEVERVGGFGTRLRHAWRTSRALPVFRTIVGIRVKPSDDGPLIAYIEGTSR
jgi:hypothetical protein